MSRLQSGGDLPEPVRRYFKEIAQMQPPNDLLDAAVADMQNPHAAHRFSPLATFGFAAAAVAGILALALLVPWLQQVASPTISQQPSPPAPSATMQLFDAEDIRSLIPRDGDFAGANVTFTGREPPWYASLRDHGLDGRWSFSLTRDEGSEDYGFIFGGWINLWSDASAARAALDFESPWSQRPMIQAIEPPAEGLGDGGRCAVVDWGTLADRGWCQFAVSNATFEMYIRTDTNGTDLHPDATTDLAILAVRLKERAEDLATGP